jgi:hypothetical protein
MSVHVPLDNTTPETEGRRDTSHPLTQIDIRAQTQRRTRRSRRMDRLIPHRRFHSTRDESQKLDRRSRMFRADRIEQRRRDPYELRISDGVDRIGPVRGCDDVQLAYRVVLAVFSKYLELIPPGVKRAKSSIFKGTCRQLQANEKALRSLTDDDVEIGRLLALLIQHLAST